MIEQDRPHELLDELSLSRPIFAGPQRPERQHVDEDRPRTDELDVVGRRVRQAHAVVQRENLDVEMIESRGLELRETPFVGIAYEGDARMVNDGEIRLALFGDLFVADIETRGLGLLVKA